jgi:acyl-CoA reductase-like NAD-dependent aldehyde dehydrogenase
MATIERKTGAERENGAGPGAIPVDNPATGEVIAHVPDTSAEDLAGIARRGRAAQPGWEARSYDERAAVMYEMRSWFVKNRERVMQTLIDETGKTREDALMAEIFFIADSLGFWAKRAERYLADQRVRSHSFMLLGRKLVIRYRPLGLVGVIGPWNYPLVNSFGDCIAALMAGNSVILKPSEVTPLSSLLMEEGLRASGLPEGVFQVATGRGETGAALVEECDYVMFTGSTETGRKVAERAGRLLKPVSLELGGKDPMVVLRDADLDRAANAAVYYAMSNSGQMCQAVERVYVEEPVYDEFVDRVGKLAGTLRQGKPGAAGTVEIGAMIFPPQNDIVERHVKDAVDKGARLLVGGHARDERGGRFYEPTVLADVDHSMEIMTEETFGPTLPIMKVGDADEAIRLANDSRYGLNSSVWTRDVDRGERLARRLKAGNSCVNDCVINYAAQELPFGGTGESGIGVRHGPQGIQKYCGTQSLLVTRFGTKREVHFFPYSARWTRIFERLLVLMYGRKPRKHRKGGG